MAAFSDVSGKLGYDIMSPMYKALGGTNGDPFSMDLGEGTPWLLGADQASTLGQYDPNMFEGYDFNWQGKGPGNSGTLTAMKDGNTVGSWGQYDTPFGETLLDAIMTAGAAFGGLGLAGAGPFSGLANLYGGAGAAGQGASGVGSILGEGAAAAIPTGAEVGALGGGQLLGAGQGMSGLGFTGGFSVPAEIGALSGASAAPSLFGGDVSSLMMTPEQFANIDGGTTLGGGLMGGGTPAGTKAAGGLSSYIDKLLSPKGASALTSLAQIYSGVTQRNNAKQMMGKLGNMSAYEQALRKQLERRDAASGRRSQYGPREVELQAKLAEMMSRNGPTLAALMQQQQGGMDRMLQGGLIGGKKLFDLFGG